MAELHHHKRKRRSHGRLPIAALTTAALLLLNTSGAAQEQILCTLVSVHIGYLTHGQTGLPAAFDTICDLRSCESSCIQNPWSCGPCAVADADGRFEYRDTLLVWTTDGHAAFGGIDCVYHNSRCRAPTCSHCILWDAFDYYCPPPYFDLDTAVHGNVDVDYYSAPPQLPAPTQLFPPDPHTEPGTYGFYWAAVDAASSYALQIDTSASHDFTTGLWRDTSASSLIIVVRDIPSDFWWRVRAANGCTSSVWTAPVVFADVDDHPSDNLPKLFQLSQNYPNPFNGGTVIRFDLDVITDWTLTIYNILGQTVRRYSGARSEGTQLVEWYGDDGIGNPMPSGMYFYRVETTRWTASRKMILLR